MVAVLGGEGEGGHFPLTSERCLFSAAVVSLLTVVTHRRRLIERFPTHIRARPGSVQILLVL